MIDCLAVMVDDDDLLAALIQFPALQRRDDVSIHDDQHGFGGQRMDRFTRRRKYLCVGIGLYIVDQLVRHARFGFDDDAAELFEGLFHDALHTDRCADAVKIGKAVSHDKDLIRVCDRAADGVGDHAHSHLAHLFCSSSRAAEEFVRVLTNDGNLVAASAERHFQRLARVELAFAHALAAAAQTDGDGRDQARRADGTDILEHRETRRDHLFDVCVAEDDHIAVIADFFVHRRVVVRPALQDRLDLYRDGGIVFLGARDKVVGVVKGDQRYAGDRRVVFAHSGFIIGILDKMTDKAVAGGQAIDGKFPAVYRNVYAVAVGNIKDVVAGQIGVDLVSLRTSAADRLAETGVTPDDIALVADHRDGVFVALQILLVNAVDPAGGAFDDAADIGAEL